jgi:hypothetical protein
MTLVAVTFHSLRITAQHSVWSNRQKLDGKRLQKAGISTDQFMFKCEPYVSGTFVVFNWEENRVVWQIAIDGPTGFCWHEEYLYINLMRLNEIVVLDGYGHELQRFSHPHLNNIHSIQPTNQGFLLTSTGTDSIIEIDKIGNLLYEWCALDHGYATLLNGEERTIDYTQDQRRIFYPTAFHTTHVNSARFADLNESKILATLFHQGTIIEIEKESGKVKTLMDNLCNPHDLRPFYDGWLVANTANNQVLVLDMYWQIQQDITMGFNWVQSSTPMSDRSIIIADTNNHRLVRVYQDTQHTTQVRSFPSDWRIYQVEEVPARYKEFFRYPIASPPL